MKFKQILFLFIGFLFLSYIIYIRIIREVIPRDLPKALYNSGAYTAILLYIMLMLLYTIALAFTASKGMGISKETKIIKILNQILNTPSKGLITINKYIIEQTIIGKYVFDVVKIVGLFLYNNVFVKNKTTILILFFRVIPYTTIFIIFFLDVVVYKRFSYIYVFSWILLLPLLERYLIYTLETFCEENYSALDEIMDILDKNTGNKISTNTFIITILFDKSQKLKKTFVYRLSTQYMNNHSLETFNYTKTLQKYQDALVNIFLPITTFLISYKIKRKILLNKFNFILLGVYLTSWTYLFIYSF